MPRLTWRPAVRKDKAALQRFECTVQLTSSQRRARVKHPRPWEREIELWIRDGLSPIPAPGSAVLLGWDRSQLVAVVALTCQDGGAATMIDLLAVEVSVRGQDGWCADEAFEEAVSWAAEQAEAVGLTTVRLLSYCHVENAHSRRGLIRQGFELVHTDRDYELWVGELPPLD